ncbi:MAG: hypothetical protein KKF15_07965 [Alphaproteobacteria bacterium]|nr:hypothetical protein [Alphaproteobacteria bacterium]
MMASPQPAEFATQPTPAWPQYWDKPTTVADDAAALPLIKICKKRVTVMQAAIAQARVQGRLHRAKGMSRRFLMSFSARLDALARAYANKKGALSKAPYGALGALVVAAGTLSPWRASPEKSLAYPVEKNDGSYRWVHKHGLLQYALELLTVGAAKPLANISQTQFLMKGGISKLDDWLRERLVNTNIVITVDIPRCFDVMSRTSVVDNLHLPRWVVKRVLFDPMDQAIFATHGIGDITLHNTTHNAKVGSPKRGVPQGSALAQLSSEIVIALVLEAVSAVAPTVHAASHGDNLIFLLEDVSRKEPVLSALTSAVAKHFGADVLGELTCRIDCGTPKSGFKFCRRTYRLRSGTLRKALPSDWVDSFSIKTLLRIETAHAAKDQVAFQKIERSIKGWLRYSPKNDEVLDAAIDLLTQLEIMRK